MKLFLKRLLETFLKIIGFFISISIGLALIISVAINETVRNVMVWVVGICIGIPTAFVILVLFGCFIWWLFVEPFQKNKKEVK